jgi:hypothetical protein
MTNNHIVVSMWTEIDENQSEKLNGGCRQLPPPPPCCRICPSIVIAPETSALARRVFRTRRGPGAG